MQTVLWQASGLTYAGGPQDTVDVEVYANWLLPWSPSLTASLKYNNTITMRPLTTTTTNSMRPLTNSTNTSVLEPPLTSEL